jgi:hypothetical protein
MCSLSGLWRPELIETTKGRAAGVPVLREFLQSQLVVEFAELRNPHGLSAIRAKW